MKREVDTRDIIKVVTKNDFIVAKGLEQLSLNARKLLYLAIAQCRKDDTEFYQYSVSPSELADLWGTKRSNVYKQADRITDELMRLFISISNDSKKCFVKKHVFENCAYDEERVLTFELHKDMTDMMLKITGDFTQPPMVEVMKIRSKYSIEIWHLMQREMRSVLPGISSPIEFELTIEELRKVTGTEDKLGLTANFKKKVLDQAIKEIRENLLANISYMDIKRGRKVVAFRFTAENCFGVLKTENMSLRDKKRARAGFLTNKRNSGEITFDEMRELDRLRRELYQLEIYDFKEFLPD